MSGTSLDDAPHPHPSPAMAVPSRTRPAQPAPHRPVPQPTPLEPITATAASVGSPTTTPIPVEIPGPLLGTPLSKLWNRVAGGGDLGDDHDPSGPSRTTSSPDRDTSPSSVRPGIEVAQIAKAVGAIIGILATAVGWVARKRGAELRHPDEEETAKVADPVARLLDRHVGSAWLTADVIDIVQIGAGTSAYVQTSPWQRAGAERPTQSTDDLPEGYEAP